MKLHLFDRFGFKALAIVDAQVEVAPRIVRKGRLFFAYERPIWDSTKTNADAGYRECDVFEWPAEAPAQPKKRERR